jgi:hypothetical protein
MSIALADVEAAFRYGVEISVEPACLDRPISFELAARLPSLSKVVDSRATGWQGRLGLVYESAEWAAMRWYAHVTLPAVAIVIRSKHVYRMDFELSVEGCRLISPRYSLPHHNITNNIVHYNITISQTIQNIITSQYRKKYSTL